MRDFRVQPSAGWAYNKERMRPAKATIITGRHHPLVKRIRAMVRSGLLLDAGEVLLETPNLIEDAIRSGAAINTVVLRAGAGAAARGLGKNFPSSAKLCEVDAKLFPEMTTTESNPGILVLVSAPVWKEEDLFAAARPLIVVLAGLQDPGNLGAILRAAEAFGASGVLITKGTVSPFNAKAIRAASGTLFRLPLLLNLTAQQMIRLLQSRKATLLSGIARGGRPLPEILGTEAGAVALALGSEGAGLPRELAAAGVPVSIPMAPQVESLNVAAAASVLLYEIARLRQARANLQKGN
jgi:RNA methyltransferase, TrmH family